MFSTAYQPLKPILKINTPYIGGICHWWYTPIENIATFPDVDPVTQKLIGEPVLYLDTNWYGPVRVIDKQLGSTETQEASAAGPYWRQTVQGFIAGNETTNHINLQNMAYHQYCVVAKVRAGGMYLVMGDKETGMDFDANYTTGIGSGETPGSKIVFNGESIKKALIMPSFSGINAIPGGGPYDPIPTGGTTTPVMEVIFFGNTSALNIPYTSGRRAKFGDFPIIEVWVINESDGKPYIIAPDIVCDHQAPNQTQFDLTIAGPASGFVILK